MIPSQESIQVKFEGRGNRISNNLEEMWCGWKDMIFQNQNIHIRWGWLKIHISRYEEQIFETKAKELAK